jgi:hypothetical protein
VTVRRCIVCDEPIEHLSKHRTTCGHPRCTRTSRGMKPERRAALLDEQAPHQPYTRNMREAMEKKAMRQVSRERDRIIELMEKALVAGSNMPDALLHVARQVGETVAVVMSVWKSVGR